MITDSHSHKINAGDVNTIFNIRINDDQISLPHGPNIFFSVGIHPWDANGFHTEWLDKMVMLLTFRQIIAVGECGFDKSKDIPYERQKEVFLHQINISETLRKPLIIHCVGYFNELMEIHREMIPKQPWIIHGFRGKPELATQLVRAGLYLSFGEKFNNQSVLITPIERIFTETDDSELDIETIQKNILLLKKCNIEDFVAPKNVFGL
jgi:TatD DNase family protein